MDHIVALANGGQHTDGNVQLLCARCNSIKGDKPMSQLMRSLWDQTDRSAPFYEWLIDRIMFDVADMLA